MRSSIGIALPAFLLAVLAAAPLAAQAPLSELRGKDARSMGMGGAFAPFTEGYAALMGNPAGFESAATSLTFADISTWTYVNPTITNIGRLSAMNGLRATEDEINSWTDSLIAENDYGQGASLGLGWVGKGIGVGLNLAFDGIVSGTGLAGSALSGTAQGNLVFGMAFPFSLGPVKVRVGADARGFLRMQSPTGGWDFQTILAETVETGAFMTVLHAQPALAGYGIAADIGATLEVGAFIFGFTWRGLGASFRMGSSSLGDIMNLKIPASENSYFMVPEFNLGAGARFQAGPLRPAFYIESFDVAGLFADPVNIVDYLHIGSEVEVTKFFTVRSGIRAGLISAGFGLHYLFMEVDAAYFTELRESGPGSIRRGLSVQAAIRL